MRIVVDMQGAQTESRYRGIGRYTLSFVQAIARNRGNHEIYLALSGIFPDTIESIRIAFDSLLPQENIRVWLAPEPLAEIYPGNQARREVAELLRESFLASLKPDVIHICSLNEGYLDDAVTSVGLFDTRTPVSVSLYDLLPLLSPDEYLKPNPSYAEFYRRKLENLKRAARFLAISDFTKQEGIAHLDVPENRFINVSIAIEQHFQPLAIPAAIVIQLHQKFGITGSFILYTGGADQRKNLTRLIHAYAALPVSLRTGCQLVFAGKMSELEVAGFQKTAKAANLKPGELCCTGYVTDEELTQLYNLCKLFVFPSWHEGFGLPVLEAMACGAPVIGANATSLPEVIGLEAALFDPMDVAAITAKMTHALEDEVFRTTLQKHGLQQAKRFSWNECAKAAVIALEHVVDARPSNTAWDDVTIQERLLESIAELKYAGKLTEVDLVQIADCMAFNAGHEKNKQLFLDISVIVHGDAKSGIQRVVRSILRELLEHPPLHVDVRPIYFDRGSYKYASKFTASFFGGANGEISDETVEFYQDDIYLALDLNTHLSVVAYDFHMQLQCRGIKMYFIVYDILLVQHPEWWPPGTSEEFETWLKSISKVSTGLICISESVASEVRAWLEQNPPKRLNMPHVSSFHLGADVENSMPSKGLPADAQMVLNKLSASTSFLLVGTLEPRKGQAQALGAFELLWSQGADLNLVIVGKQGWMVDALVQKIRNHPELNKRMFWLEGISDEYLARLYDVSACLVAASEGEGFGLPLIEAAKYHKPIIARDLPVFREVAADNAIYFSGLESINLAECVTAWLEQYKQDAHPKSEGMTYLTWQESVMQLKDQLTS